MTVASLPPPAAIQINAGPDAIEQRLSVIAPLFAAYYRRHRARLPARSIAAQREFVREGRLLSGVHAVRSGWAGVVRMFPDGRRQIQHILLPGDVLFHPAAAPMPSSIVALTPATLVRLDGGGLSIQPLLEEAMRWSVADAMGRLLIATARLGRQSATERMAHLMLELRDRLLAAGEGGRTRFAMPLTQEMLADVLGLTSVHVNRTLQAMRQQGLMELRGRTVELFAVDRLVEIADYRAL